jgi:hypothetical protein
VTVGIELERRARRLEHWVSSGKRPEAAIPLEAEGREPLLDLGAGRHDDVDVAGQIEAGRPVRDGKPADDDRANPSRAKRGIDDSCDFEHLLGRIGNVGGSPKVIPKSVEIFLVRRAGHSQASPNTSRPRRRRAGQTIGPSAAGASCSNISLRSRPSSARRSGSPNRPGNVRRSTLRGVCPCVSIADERTQRTGRPEQHPVSIPSEKRSICRDNGGGGNRTRATFPPPRHQPRCVTTSFGSAYAPGGQPFAPSRRACPSTPARCFARGARLPMIAAGGRERSGIPRGCLPRLWQLHAIAEGRAPSRACAGSRGARIRQPAAA